MNFDPTSVIPDYPSEALEKILDLGEWNSSPTAPNPASPPPSQPAAGGSGLMVAAGIAGLAVLVTVVVVAKKRGKR